METWTKDVKWGGVILGRTTKEKDLEVTLSAEINVSEAMWDCCFQKVIKF